MTTIYTPAGEWLRIMLADLLANHRAAVQIYRWRGGDRARVDLFAGAIMECVALSSARAGGAA